MWRRKTLLFVVTLQKNTVNIALKGSSQSNTPPLRHLGIRNVGAGVFLCLQFLKSELLTYKWNLINKTNKQVKYNQRCGNKEHTDSNQRGEGRGIRGERKGRVVKEHV